MIRLVPLSAADLERLANGEDAIGGRTIAEGALPPLRVLSMLRDVARASSDADPFAWLVTEADAVIGMLSFTRFASNADVVAQNDRHDFGYIVAPQHHGRGVASEAISLLIEIARARGYKLLTAETAPDNEGSQRVLIKNGFRRISSATASYGGKLISWSLELRADRQL